MESESTILSIVGRKRGGILEYEAEKVACETMTQSEWSNALQNLMFSKVLIREKDADHPYLRIVAPDYAELHLTGHQLIIYRVIDMVGSKGITEDEIVKKVHGKNFPIKKDIKKALKSLLDAHHLQTIQSIRNRKEVLYLVAGIEPKASLTGGRWYTKDKDFDSAYVREIREACVKYFHHHDNGLITPEEVHRWIIRNEIASRVDIDDVAQILFTFELDGVIHAVQMIDHSWVKSDRESSSRPQSHLAAVYMLSEQVTLPPLFEAPCTACPYLHDCDPENLGLISPLTIDGLVRCPYLQDWLCQNI